MRMKLEHEDGMRERYREGERKIPLRALAIRMEINMGTTQVACNGEKHAACKRLSTTAVDPLHPIPSHPSMWLYGSSWQYWI
jgi:hypothetical protein